MHAAAVIAMALGLPVPVWPEDRLPSPRWPEPPSCVCPEGCGCPGGKAGPCGCGTQRRWTACPGRCVCGCQEAPAAPCGCGEPAQKKGPCETQGR